MSNVAGLADPSTFPPGPYVVTGPNGSLNQIGIGRDTGPNGYVDPIGVAYGAGKQVEAIANLFAAAPDMYTILDELEEAFDKEIYPEQVKEDFDALDEREYSVTITAKQWRAISRALSKVQHGE